MSTVSNQELRQAVDQYRWYHRIKVAEDLYTTPYFWDNGGSRWSFQRLWDFGLRSLQSIDFAGKRVLDVGCRDGMFSFEAERRGAREVVGVDRQLSRGAKELLIPLFQSQVQMHELSLYELTPERFGLFDIILFPGVLYHLRYPFLALATLVRCLNDRGLLFIESGMLVDKKYEDHDILWCPVENTPYTSDTSSCTFFNKMGLCTTLRSLSCQLLSYQTLEESDPTHKTGWWGSGRRSLSVAKDLLRSILNRQRHLQHDRQTFIFQKDIEWGKQLGFGLGSELEEYWAAR
jgi:SAM-dependent methyltransferase